MYAASQGASAPEWLEGLGLCAPSLLDRLAAETSARVAVAGGRIALSALAALLAAGETPLSEAAVEALAPRAGLRIERATLFAADVVMPGEAPPQRAETVMRPEPVARDLHRKAQPRKAAPRTHSGAGWSAETLFPIESTIAGDGSEPDATPPPPHGETRHHTS
jgi:hypothetical protein